MKKSVDANSFYFIFGYNMTKKKFTILLIRDVLFKHFHNSKRLKK